MKATSISRLILAAAIAAPFSASAVLIDIGANGGRNEPGALFLTGQPNHNNSGNFGPTAIGGGITLTVNNGGTSGSMDWRDRGDSTSSDPLVFLGEDFVKNNAGVVRLTLTGIAVGTYNATSYHIDPSFTQSQNIRVFLDDDGGGLVNTGAVGNSFDSGVPGVNGLTTALIQGTAASFQFTSDGVNPVIIQFDGSLNPGPGENGETPVNGIEFTLIPEPSSAILALFGGLAFIVRRRR